MAISRSSALVIMVVASLACVGASGGPAVAPANGAAPSATTQDAIQHVSPPRDSVGAQPKSFEWTAVAGADGYALLLVTEVDMKIWEVTIQATSVDLPKDLVLDSGTYFWAVGAFRGGRQVAYSGRSAFVVLQ